MIFIQFHERKITHKIALVCDLIRIINRLLKYPLQKVIHTYAPEL